jgi:hypothetical protein
MEPNETARVLDTWVTIGAPPEYTVDPSVATNRRARKASRRPMPHRRFAGATAIGEEIFLVISLFGFIVFFNWSPLLLIGYLLSMVV